MFSNSLMNLFMPFILLLTRCLYFIFKNEPHSYYCTGMIHCYTTVRTTFSHYFVTDWEMWTIKKRWRQKKKNGRCKTPPKMKAKSKMWIEKSRWFVEYNSGVDLLLLLLSPNQCEYLVRPSDNVKDNLPRPCTAAPVRNTAPLSWVSVKLAPDVYLLRSVHSCRTRCWWCSSWRHSDSRLYTSRGTRWLSSRWIFGKRALPGHVRKPRLRRLEIWMLH